MTRPVHSTPQDHLYQKEVKGGYAYYGDFRGFRHVGGRQEALIPPGERYATRDESVAIQLAQRRLNELRQLDEEVRPWSAGRRELATLAGEYLVARATAAGTPTRQWMLAMQHHLERAIEYFGAAKDLTRLRKQEIQGWGRWLEQEAPHAPRSKAPHPAGKKQRIGFSSSSVHKHYCTLGGLLRWGAMEGVLPDKFRTLVEDARRGVNKQSLQPTYRPTEWLTVEEMGEILRWLRDDWTPRRSDACPFLFQAVATAAHTGARRNELFRIEVGDLDFERRRVRICTPTDQGQKKSMGTRWVPMSSELRDILRAYLDGPHAPNGSLLFPARNGGVISDIRTREDIPLPTRFGRSDPRNVGRPKKSTTYLAWTMLRHTYCSARLQTLDRGYPISKFTVQKELGHNSSAMIDKVYGHVENDRYRGSDVRYLHLDD